MKKFGVILSVFAICFFAGTLSVQAETTKDNIWTIPHATPEVFYTHPAGGFYGVTTDGELFRQYPLFTDSSILIHKFAIGTAFFYVSDRGFIKASSDLVAISMYLARA